MVVTERIDSHFKTAFEGRAVGTNVKIDIIDGGHKISIKQNLPPAPPLTRRGEINKNI